MSSKVYDDDEFDFKKQIEDDLDVLINIEELAAIHKIGGVMGDRTVSEKECNVVVDRELYRERKIKDDIENVSLDGLVFFIKKREYLDKFAALPNVRNLISLDGKKYLIEALSDDMGLLEFTIRAASGRG